MTGTIQAMVGSRLLELARDARKGGPPCARKQKGSGRKPEPL